MQTSLQTCWRLTGGKFDNARHKGRIREEGYLGAFLRELPNATLEKIVDAIQNVREHGIVDLVDNRIENLALGWRKALLSGDRETTTMLFDMALKAGGSDSLAAIQTVIKAAQVEHASNQAIMDKEEEEETTTGGEVITTVDGAQVLAEYADLLKPKEQVQRKTKSQKKLLQALRAFATTYMEVVTGGETDQCS